MNKVWGVFRKGKKSGLIKKMSTCKTEGEAKEELRKWRELYKRVGDNNYTFKISWYREGEEK
jgi:hypothetical protein